jgi:hypothetical protein
VDGGSGGGISSGGRMRMSGGSWAVRERGGGEMDSEDVEREWRSDRSSSSG